MPPPTTRNTHSYAELTAALQAAVKAHPDLAKISSIGKTRGGRDIWAVEIAQPSGTPVDQRPALLVAANFEGDHLVGSELALVLVESLLNGYAADATIKQRLDNHVIYVLPRVNADGAESCSPREDRRAHEPDAVRRRTTTRVWTKTAPRTSTRTASLP